MITPLSIKGHITISDVATGEVLIDKDNQIHYENMSQSLAYSIARQTENFYIASMAFGNGGTSVDPTGVITYLPPNTNTQQSDLYNPTYSKIINQAIAGNTDPENNKIEIRHLDGEVYTDILISCRLDYGEPSGQAAFDTAENTDGDYVFDELGIKNSRGDLLTHVIFHPIQKSLNRQIQVDYTIRVQTLSSISTV
jgi:hypothetical protein